MVGKNNYQILFLENLYSHIRRKQAGAELGQAQQQLGLGSIWLGSRTGPFSLCSLSTCFTFNAALTFVYAAKNKLMRLELG